MTHLILVAALGLLIQAGPQQRTPEQARTMENAALPREKGAPGMGIQDRDPFWKDWGDFGKKEEEWRRLDEEIEDRLSEMPACSPSVVDLIRQVRESAGQCFAAQADYYAKWRNLARSDRELFRKLMADRGTLRNEIETSLENARRQLAELQDRKQLLQQSLEQAKPASDGKENKALNALIKSSQDRIANYEGALKKWEDAQRYNTDSMQTAENLETSVAQLHALLESEASNWNMYYEARQARAQLQCVTERQPQVWTHRKPPE